MDYLKLKHGFPTRHVFTIWSFLGFLISSAMNLSLGVAIVAMVKIPMNATEDDDLIPSACQELFAEPQNGTSHLKQELQGEFDWDRNTQSLALGALFYGCLVTSIPGGILADRWSAKWLFGLGIFMDSLLSLLSPVAARWSVNAFITLRVIQGLTAGVLSPVNHALVARWAPKMERSRMSTFIYSGELVGIVVGLTTSGFLSKSYLLGGWPSAFYVFGTLGCIWFVFWTFLIYDTPEDHPRISQSELLYITENETSKHTDSIPWRQMLTSVQMWTVVIAKFGQGWLGLTLMTEMPTYLANILHFRLEDNGILSSIPYILQTLVGWIASYVADQMRQSGKLTITAIRKIFNSIGFFGSGVCILMVAFIGCRPIVSVSLLCLALAFIGANSSGVQVIAIDMSPRFAGTINGISYGIVFCSGFLAPLAAGSITANGETLYNWGIVFGITAGITFVTGLIFALFASAELQSWNEPSNYVKHQSNFEMQDPSAKMVITGREES